MTICMGEIREELFASVSKELCAIGREVDLEVVAYGEVLHNFSVLTRFLTPRVPFGCIQDQKAAAVMVQSGIPTLNSIPHVTIAVSPIGICQLPCALAQDSNSSHLILLFRSSKGQSQY